MVEGHRLPLLQREISLILYCLITCVKQGEERMASIEFFNLSFKGILEIITFAVLIQNLAEKKNFIYIGFSLRFRFYPNF